jgi:branched-chain amino acid transport system substrate-binding protein
MQMVANIVRRAAGGLVALSTMLPAAGAESQELRIGFVNTNTGGGAILGRQMENGWKLGLEHAGWHKDGDKLGGVATRIYYADDQARPDVGVREVSRLLNQDKVQIIAGVIFSNVALAVRRSIFDANAMLLSTNAAAALFAGAECNPLFVSTSFITDGAAEALGEIATKDGVKSVVALAPNYQSGKDNIAGFARTFKSGKVVEQILFKLGETDFQVDIAKIRAAKPQAIFIFAPGAMGISFMKQWAATGGNRDIQIYSMYVVDHLTLPAIGAAALGVVEASHWNHDADNPKNRRFVKDYVAKFGHAPSFIAVHSYDAPELLAKAIQTAGGKADDMRAVARAMRLATLDSPRGALRYHFNGFLIEPYWRITVQPGADGRALLRVGEKIMERADSYGQDCPVDKRI